MVSRKTQLAWMAAGGILSLFTIVISCKVREGNRCAAEGDKVTPIAVVPMPAVDDHLDLKPVPILTPTDVLPLPPPEGDWVKRTRSPGRNICTKATSPRSP